MQKQLFLYIAISLFLMSCISAQNIGIGTDNPQQMLSVAGSIAVDHDNENTGSPTGPSLLFGTNPSLAAISSRKSAGSSATNGLEFWTNGQRRMLITENGTIAIGVENPDPSFDLFVGGATKTYSLFATSAQVSSILTVNGTTNAGSQLNVNGGAYHYSYKFTVNNGNSYFGGNVLIANQLDIQGNSFLDGSLTVAGVITGQNTIVGHSEVRGAQVRANEYMSVGGALDPNYRLRVWDGNSRFGGDVQVTGTLNAGDLNTDDLTANSVNGTGIVRSNGPSPLRIGFNQEGLNHTLNGGGQADVTVNITPFEGGPDDVRVFVSQFVPDPLPQYSNWHDFSFHVHSVNPVNDTCKVRITNTTDGSLSIKGTLYLTSIAKN